MTRVREPDQGGCFFYLCLIVVFFTIGGCLQTCYLEGETMATPTEMDEAAEAARQEFQELPEEARKAMTAWWKKHYTKAGHKRLGRVVVKGGEADE